MGEGDLDHMKDTALLLFFATLLIVVGMLIGHQADAHMVPSERCGGIPTIQCVEVGRCVKPVGTTKIEGWTTYKDLTDPQEED